MNDKILLIGLGSVLMQDEGIGVRVVELIESRYEIPDTLEIMDGGTTAMDLLEPMRNRQQVIIVDAINTGAAPGTRIRIENQDIPQFFQTKISNHQLALSDLLATLRLTEQSPGNVVVLGLVPYHLENKLLLSSESENKLEEMIEMTLEELSRHGIKLELREKPLPCFWEAKSHEEILKCA